MNIGAIVSLCAAAYVMGGFLFLVIWRAVELFDEWDRDLETVCFVFWPLSGPITLLVLFIRALKDAAQLWADAIRERRKRNERK